MRDDVRARARVGAWLAGLAGFLVLLISGVRSGPYLPNWQDPGDGLPCSFSAGGCPADVDAALRSLWWWSAAGGVLLVIAVVVHTWSLSSVQEEGRTALVPVVLRAAGLGAGCVALSAGLALGVVVALLVTAHLLPAAFAVCWVVQAAVVAAVEQTAGTATPRRASATGLLSSALATGVTAWLFFDAPSHAGFRLLLVDGTLIAGGVLVAAVLGSSRRRRVRAAAGLLTVAAASGVVTLAWTAAHRPAPAPQATYRTPPPAAPATTTPEAEPAAPPPAPATTTAPPAPVRTSVPCAATDLDWQVTGFDAALGARFASLVVTNTGSRACYVDGFPVVVLAQGGRPLDLTVTEGSSTAPGTPGTAQRVGIAPGGTALSGLYWRTYGGLADAVTPQSVSAALAGGTPFPVPVAAPPGHGPAPFDLADGGAWQVGNWIPGTG